MKVERFNPPGNLSDFDGQAAQKWSDFIISRIDTEISGLAQQNLGLQPQFYNPAKLDVSGMPVPISWPAFPNLVKIKYGDDPQRMFEEAERRDNQDEYLEWATNKRNGKIIRIMFTCEGPEYWKFIADYDPHLLATLYSKIAKQHIDSKDLVSPGGRYNPQNKWNMEYAVHLVQVNNTLSAEIDIACQATVLRRHDGHDPVTDSQELIMCSGFGVAERNSDPHIGDVVNLQARKGCSVTLENPVGLYIAGLPKPDDLKALTPDGKLADDRYWTIERGDKDHILRLIFEVPQGETANGQPFVVGDLKIDGDAIDFGGKVADALRIKLTGVIGKEGVFHNESYPCPGGGALLVAHPLSRKA